MQPAAARPRGAGSAASLLSLPLHVGQGFLSSITLPFHSGCDRQTDRDRDKTESPLLGLWTVSDDHRGNK